jgi:hypothetical protein
MHIDALIANLELSKGDNRKLESEIGLLAGFQRSPTSKKKYTWLFPNGNVGYLPRFTFRIEGAKELTDILCPGKAVAVTFDSASKLAQAQIEDGERVIAQTIPLALCISALKYHRAQENNHKQAV